MKCELSFTILYLWKQNFLVVHQSDCHVFMLVIKTTISTYFNAVDFDSVPHISTMRFITRCKWREYMRQIWCRDRFRSWAIIKTFVGVVQHNETEDAESQLRAEQEKSRIHAGISFLLVSWDIDMCQRLYRKNYNIHVLYWDWLLNCI